MVEDALFEIDQFRSRVEPEIFGQQVPGALGRVKCVDLATGALQGQHEFCPERFAPRFGTEFGFEPFDNHFVVQGHYLHVRSTPEERGWVCWNQTAVDVK